MNFNRILAVFFRYFYVLRKGPQQLSDLLYWPLVDILLWGLTSIWIQTESANANLPLLLLTGLIFWQVVWRGSVDVSVFLLQEFWQRNMINLFSTPLKISEWIFGVLSLSFCKLFITVGFAALAVYLLYSINVFTIGIAFIPFTVSLIIFGWSIGFIASSLIVYWGHQIETIAWMVGFLFAPFSAVFYPVSILPSWAQTIAWSLPTTYIFEGMREILAGGTFPYKDFWISMTLNVIYTGFSLTLFQFMFEKSRNKGLARLE